MKPVFLDSVGLIALWNRSDQWHAAATDAFDALEADGRRYVSTPFVLAECGNTASRRGFRDKVVIVRRSLEADDSLIWPTDEEWHEAWAAYERGRPGDPGIVDCVSFVVMRRLGLAEAFTNDQHFAAAGFTPLF